MDLLIPLILILPLIGIHRTDDSLKCLNKTQTSSINGVAIVLIIIRHFFQYISPGKYDGIMCRIDNHLGQLIVVSFLFFSGYAFVKQYQKSDKYLEKMPRKIISLYLIFVITVMSFAVIGFVLGEKYRVVEYLLALIGMYSVGNSTWYVVAILMLWGGSYMSYRQRIVSPFIIMFLWVGIYTAVMYLFKSDVFYNTVIAYLCGMIYCSYEMKLQPIINKYYAIIFGGATLAILMGSFYKPNIVIYELWVVAFCIFLLLISMKVQFNNKALDLLNKYSLELYLIQRIPMIVLKGKIDNNLVYFCTCCLIMGGIAFVWKKLFLLIDRCVTKIIVAKGDRV